MRTWIVEAGEPLPIDAGDRPLRCGILCERLVAAGHQVLWWASTFDHTHKRHRFDQPTTVTVTPGLTLRLLHGPGYSHNVSLKRLLHNRRVAAEFARDNLRCQPRPNLIFCCMPTPELAEKSVEFGRAHHIPVVIDVRDIWPDSYLSFAPQPLRTAGRLALAPEFRRMRRICSDATALTAVSETFLRWALKRAGRARTSLDGVFPLGYPTPPKWTESEEAAAIKRLCAGHPIRRDAFVVAFVGVFGASYDLKTVVEAARLMAQRESKSQFVLAGDGGQGARLRERARGLPNVVFTGWLGQESVRALLALSSLGLACYAAPAPQSLPNKPYEYMAAGLPIVSSLRGELGELIEAEKIGLHYVAGDAHSLVSAINTLRVNPKLRQAMGARARRLFDELYSVPVVYGALREHLESLARGAFLDAAVGAGCAPITGHAQTHI